MLVFRDPFNGVSEELSLHSPLIGDDWERIEDSGVGNTLKTNGLGQATDLVFGGNITLYASGRPTDTKNYTIDLYLRWGSSLPGLVVRASETNVIRLQNFVIDPMNPTYYLFSASGGMASAIAYTGFTASNGDRVLMRIKVSDAGGGQLRYQMFLAHYGEELVQYGADVLSGFAYSDTDVRVGLCSGGGAPLFDELIAFDNGTTPIAGEISAIRRLPTSVILQIEPPIAYEGPISYQWKRSLTSGSGHTDVGTDSLTLEDTGLTPGEEYYYLCEQTDDNGTVTSTEFAVRTPTEEVFCDYFDGIAGAWVDAPRETTDENGDDTGRKWRANSTLGKLSGTGLCNLPASTAHSPLYARIRSDIADGVWEAQLESLTTGRFLNVAICVDPVTGRGYEWQMGYYGFAHVSSVVTLPNGTQLLDGDTGSNETSLDGAANQPLTMRLTLSTLDNGLRNLQVEYKVGAGSYTLLRDIDLSSANSAAAPGVFALAGVGPITYATGTYSPVPGPDPVPDAAVAYGGCDSNHHFYSPSGGILGGARIPDAVGALLRNHYPNLVLFDHAHSGSKTADWLPGGDLLSHSLAVVESEGVKVVVIGLGTNDGSDGNNVSADDYADNIESIRDAYLAAGATHVVLIDMPTINTSAPQYPGGFSGSEARYVTYRAKNGLLATGNTSRIAGLVANYAAHLERLSGDGIHYAHDSQGAADARDIEYEGLLPVVQAAYPISTGEDDDEMPLAGNYTPVTPDDDEDLTETVALANQAGLYITQGGEITFVSEDGDTISLSVPDRYDFPAKVQKVTTDTNCRGIFLKTKTAT